jgi:glucose/arabinose dehydrogenase
MADPRHGCGALLDRTASGSVRQDAMRWERPCGCSSSPPPPRTRRATTGLGRGLWVGLVSLLTLAAPALAARARPADCADGRFVVAGEPVPGDGRLLEVAGRRIELVGVCPATRLGAKNRRGILRVRARFRNCTGDAPRLVLDGRLETPLCRTLAGRVRVPGGTPRAFLAKKSIRTLMFSRTTGFRHPSIADAQRVLGALDPAGGITVTQTEDPTVFVDSALGAFDVVMFVNTTGDVLDDAQQAALERFVGSGRGWVGVHSAADTEYDWPWYGRLVGAYFISHPLLPVTVTVTTEDPDHPSTAHLPPTFTFTDEIYNFDHNPRVDHAILLTIDEGGFTFPNFPPTQSMGADHPIAWYKEFEGGRAFYTNLGHRPETWSDPRFLTHLLAGIRWAAGPATWSRQVVTQTARNPMALAVAPDGAVYWIERTGEVQRWSPRTGRVIRAAEIAVDTTAENGLLGIALDPAFAENRFVYLYHSDPIATPPPAGPPGRNVLARYTARRDGTLDLATRHDLLAVPSERQCCHEGGSLAFAPDGTLFLSTGDNTNPFASSGAAPLDERPGRETWNSQRTAQNPFDLRGKILRINPDGSIPPGNLFSPSGVAGRPEVFVMGTRNPFRIAVDGASGRLFWGEVGPDAFADGRLGPRGYDEINFADTPGNYGWPYCIADNLPYADYDYATDSVMGAFACDAYHPALLWYDYTTVSHLALGDAFSTPRPSTLGSFNGRTAIAGTVHHDPSPTARFSLPAPFADTLLMLEWARDRMVSLEVAADGILRGVRRMMPWENFRRPIDAEVGPDGALYVLEYGSGYFGDNVDAGVTRIEWSAEGALTPVAVITGSATSGTAPLAIELSGETSRPAGLGDPIVRYLWDVDGDGRTDVRGPRLRRTFRRSGVYPITLVVKTASGRRSLPAVQEVVVGNAPPTVRIDTPADGTPVHEGSTLVLRGSGSDPEDGVAACERLVWDIRLGHNTHAHPIGIRSGCEVPLALGRGAHDDLRGLFYAVELSYTDQGGPDGEPPSTARHGIRLPLVAASASGAFLD